VSVAAAIWLSAAIGSADARTWRRRYTPATAAGTGGRLSSGGRPCLTTEGGKNPAPRGPRRGRPPSPAATRKCQADGESPSGLHRCHADWKRDVGRRSTRSSCATCPNVPQSRTLELASIRHRGPGLVPGFHVFAATSRSLFPRQLLHAVPKGGTAKDARWIDVPQSTISTRPAGEGGSGSRRPPPVGASLTLVRCAHSGVHLR